jgi:hypothetical protein
MIIFESTLTTFEASFIFLGSWGSIKNRTTICRFSFAKSLKHTVDFFTKISVVALVEAFFKLQL